MGESKHIRTNLKSLKVHYDCSVENDDVKNRPTRFVRTRWKRKGENVKERSGVDISTCRYDNGNVEIWRKIE